MPGMNLTRAEARERAALITVDSYEVSLDLTRGGKVFGSTTTVKFTAAPGSSTFIDAVTDAVHSVTLNGRELDPAEVSDGIRIQLPDLAADNELTVVADAPYMNTGEGLHRFVDPVDNEVYLYTPVRGARTRAGCSPSSNSPTSRPPSASRVTAPSHWDVVSNSPTPAPGAASPGTTAAPARLGLRAHAAAVLLRHRADRRPVPVGAQRGDQLGRPRHPAGRLRPQVPDAVPGRGEHLRAHPAGLRVLRGPVRLPLPVREVRPAVRAGVQRRRHGERRGRHHPGRLRLPRQGHRTPRWSAAPSPCCTSWRTCGSATS